MHPPGGRPCARRLYLVLPCRMQLEVRSWMVAAPEPSAPLQSKIRTLAAEISSPTLKKNRLQAWGLITSDL